MSHRDVDTATTRAASGIDRTQVREQLRGVPEHALVVEPAAHRRPATSHRPGVQHRQPDLRATCAGDHGIAGDPHPRDARLHRAPTPADRRGHRFYRRFLVAGLYTDDDALFTGSITWTADILTARGIPAATLFPALDLLGRQLHEFPRSQRLLNAALSALAGEKSPATDPT